MRTSIVFVLALTACANIGPFRANGDDDGSPDGGVSGDGRMADSMLVDASEQVAPTKLTSITGRPYELAATDGYVYWTQLEAHKIGRIPKAGGSAQTTDTVGVPLLLAASGHDAYWVADDAIRQVSDSSFTASAPLYSNVALEAPLAISTSDIYFFQRGSGVDDDELRSLPRAGGTSNVLRSDLSEVRTLSIDSTTLYVAHGEVIEKSAVASPGETTLVGTAFANQLTSAAGRACWTMQPNLNLPAHELWCSIFGDKVKIAAAQQDFLSVVISDTHLFWSARDNSAATHVFGYSFTTGQTTPIWNPPTGTSVISLAVDGDALYWLTARNTAGDVWSLPL